MILHPQLRGLYISTVNSMPVLRAAEQEGRLDGLTVITTDLFPELVDWIRAGRVAATVYQRPLTQGRMALQALYQFLQRRERIHENQRVVPYVVMRSNVDLVLSRLSIDRGDADPPAAARREARTAAARPRGGAPWRRPPTRSGV